MADLIYIAVVFGFFGLCVGYAYVAAGKGYAADGKP